YQPIAECQARMWKATGADGPAQALSASQREPVFVYRFDWDEEPTLLGADLSQMLGAAHAFEVPFVFGHFDLGRDGNVIFTEQNRPGREALSQQMMGYWAQFARTGDPGRGPRDTEPAWPPGPRGGTRGPRAGLAAVGRRAALPDPRHRGGRGHAAVVGRGHARGGDRRRRRRSAPADPARQVRRLPLAGQLVARLHARAVPERRREGLRRLPVRHLPLARLIRLRREAPPLAPVGRSPPGPHSPLAALGRAHRARRASGDLCGRLRGVAPQTGVVGEG